MELQTILYVLAALMMLVGTVGVVLPVLPGLPLTFAGMLLAAWVGGFQQVGWITLTVLGVLTALSVVVDLLSTALGAQRVGASRLAIIGSIIGTLAGLLFLPIGILVGPFAGALIGEMLHGRELGQATKVGLATWMGLMLGVVLKVGLAFAMLAVFFVAWFH
ncbi:DUF456 domain-containing protein [Pseudoxanthomonas spadix]|uniref:DUF456 domain-containing protein n=1 Tax=Pseudoxanthomonas spadix TaxID=415229 RepID=UPI000F009153|nr:DUF456 domain-containing protein [Pseudoxanthomonas spadix]MBP3975088.1 DUF456 domain-containing protein [Pseudoxanthomonas spadix]RMW98200.1 DUF456 domain-containing protein [Pseudoxanthomonas spadix]